MVWNMSAGRRAVAVLGVVIDVQGQAVFRTVDDVGAGADSHHESFQGFRHAEVGSGAAAHPANHVITGKAVLQTPCLEPIDIHRIGQVPRRLDS